MSCKWNRTDCKNLDAKCYLCFLEDQFYVSNTKVKVPKKAKETGRKGSKFEAVNSNTNNAILLGSSPTPNSGATARYKGDEQIHGLIEIMEELKEQNQTTSKGAKTFTIHKEWLDKLKREALAEHKEFWYLKFCFSTQDALDGVHYAIIDTEQLMSMVKTMWEDRKKANSVQREIDLHKTRANTAETEIAYLKAQIDELKAYIAFIEGEEDEK